MKKVLFSLVALAAPFLAAGQALAQGSGSTSNDFDAKMFGFIAAGLGISLAAFGGAMGQGRASAAALEGIARNPGAAGKLFVPMLLGLALIESLVIYVLVIAFQIIGKI